MEEIIQELQRKRDALASTITASEKLIQSEAKSIEAREAKLAAIEEAIARLRG